MSLASFSVRRPVAMCCLIIGLSLLGGNAYRKMGLENFPKVDLPYVTVLTVYPGGSPQEIETDIAKRIEDAVSTIDGLKHLIFACMENACQTVLEFQLEVDVDIAANDVREKIDLILNDFPEGTEKPKILKFNINSIPIVNLALTGDLPLDEIYDYADQTLRDRLTVLKGVADVKLIGGAKREVQVLLDRQKLAARGLTSMDVVQTLRKEVKTIPSGRIRENTMEYSVKFDAEYKTLPEIGNLELKGKNGSRCYIRDIGRVEMNTEELRQMSYIDGKPAVAIQVVKRAEANAVKVVDSIKGALAKLQADLPGGMQLVWVSDDAVFIRSSVESTISDIWQGILLTALILFLFLYNVRSTIIVAITMPVTILIGLFFIGAMGYTLNVSTLMSTGLSVGILVTNSIVVLENILKRFEESGDAKAAANIGASEVLVAVSASALTNLVVLFPVAFMGTQVGLFLAPFAWTMIIMTAVSLFISFTLTPIMASVLLKPRKKNSRSPLILADRAFNWMFDKVSAVFAKSLLYFERHKTAAILMLILSCAMFWQSLTIAKKIGFDFMPETDQAQVFVKLEFPTHYNLHQTISRVHEAEEKLKTLPAIEHMLTTIGRVEGQIGRISEGVYLAQVLVKFVEKTERPQTMKDLLATSRELMRDFPDCTVSVSQPSAVGGQNIPIELEIAGEDLTTLDRLALRVRTLAQQVQGVTDPDTTVRAGKPELRVLPNRAVLADMDVPATGVGLTMRANLEGIEAGIYKEKGRNYDIVVKLDEEEGKSQVGQFLLPAAPGHPITLSTVSQVEEHLAPVQILRKNKQRISKLYAGLEPGTPMGTAVDELNASIEQNSPMPPGYSYSYYGQYELMQEATAAFMESIIIAILLIYLVLSAMLESFKQPFIILVTLPLGLVGVLWALAAAGESINMLVLLGMVMLIGIVVNNAILIMDQLNQYVSQGVPRHQAMVRAASEKFRAIVMITLAAILGMWPLATATGIGSETRTGLGVASIGGIGIAAVLTLVIIPILYDLFTRRQHKK